MRAAAAGIAAPAGACAPPRGLALERLRGLILWLTVVCGAFVFMEPSPYEVASLLAIVVFALTGSLVLRPALIGLALLLLAYNIGFSIAVIPLLGEQKPVTWVLVSWYLAVTSLFFAAALGRNTEQRLSLIVRGYLVAAAIASLAGVAGYFSLLPGADLFLRYGRAQGTFNDPNVLGAFIVPAALFALQRVFDGRPAQALRNAALFGLYVLALLLTFSRGAWGQFALAAVLMTLLALATSTSPRERARIVLIAAFGLVLTAAFLAVLLSIGRIAELFEVRASLEQSYDTGHTGRFGRHALGFVMALDRPLGLGPMQFHKFFGEDPHNAYLNAFVSGGWLAGFAYLTLTAVTLVRGLRLVVLPGPTRKACLAVYAAFAAVAVESLIIDTDHWRHYFLLIGILWGLMAVASRPTPARAPEPRSARPATLARQPLGA